MPAIIQKLINHFNALPGIGQKTAERFVFYLLKQDKKKLSDFADTLLHIKDNIKNCKQCGQISENNLCQICANSQRNQSLICVVAENSDILPLEKAGEFNGVYHVLHGVLNPTEGINDDKLNIKNLIARIEKNNISEIILALNPTIEGETTSMYLNKYLNTYLNKYNFKITKLARGLPQGSDLEYADEVTLANAFKGRMKI